MSVVSFHAGNPVTLTLICTVVFVFSPTALAFPSTLVLERAFPVNHRIELSQLRHRDSLRHRRILQQQSSSSGAVDFPVKGSYDPSVVGLYYTKVQLGSPPKEYYVQIDTGSNVLWVACTPCDGCPTSSGLQIPMELYDPSSSSTSSAISCSDKRCHQAEELSDSGCSNDKCSYQFLYGDGSGTSGYYVSDVMHLDMIGAGSTSANVVFGCSTSQSQIRPSTPSDIVVNGIFGFGQSGLSLISQLSAQGTAPDSFSHCLDGSDNGGGILVIGQVIEPHMVYTPIIQSQLHYNVNLESISVNGQTLSIDPSLFDLLDNHEGTIIDSGTTLSYLTEGALKLFVDAISQSVSQSVQRLLTIDEMQCYVTTSSISDVFPLVGFHFAGGASMHLKPRDYLLQRNSVRGAEVWCNGFGSMPNQQITILGDLVLKDKIIVYDLGRQRIGWSDYDCSTSVNVSAASSGGRREVVNVGQVGGTAALQITRYELITRIFIIASIIRWSGHIQLVFTS